MLFASPFLCKTLDKRVEKQKEKSQIALAMAFLTII